MKLSLGFLSLQQYLLRTENPVCIALDHKTCILMLAVLFLESSHYRIWCNVTSGTTVELGTEHKFRILGFSREKKIHTVQCKSNLSLCLSIVTNQLI